MPASKHPEVMGFQTDAAHRAVPVAGRESVRAPYYIGLLYNPATLEFELPTKGDLELWLDQRFDYTSGSLDYKGVNETHKALITDTDWYVWKYTWSSGNCTRIEGPLKGSWQGRAALSWG